MTQDIYLAPEKWLNGYSYSCRMNSSS